MVGTALVVGLTTAAPALADDPVPAPAVVEGTVAVAGVLKAGATVRLSDGVDPAVETTTDALGHYDVEVPVGSYLVCAGMTDNSVHHSCTPGSALGTDAHPWAMTEGGRQTLDFTLETSDHDLARWPAGASAAWVRSGRHYKLVYDATGLVFRPRKGVANLSVEVAAVRAFGGSTSPFPVDLEAVAGFVRYPSWGAVQPVTPFVGAPTVFDDEPSCGLAADQGPGRPPQMWAVPAIVTRVTNAKTGSLLEERSTPVDESACRRDRLTFALRGVIRDQRRQLRLSARTDSAVQVYRPVVRVYRSSGKLLGKRRLRVDGSIKPIWLPRKHFKRKVEVRVVLPPTDGSPRFVVRRTVTFPRR